MPQFPIGPVIFLCLSPSSICLMADVYSFFFQPLPRREEEGAEVIFPFFTCSLALFNSTCLQIPMGTEIGGVEGGVEGE